MLPPALDDDLGFGARAEPFETEALIAEFAVKAFADDIQNGRGTYSFPGGAKYVGEIKDGFYDGQRAYTSAEGWTQSGL